MTRIDDFFSAMAKAANLRAMNLSDSDIPLLNREIGIIDSNSSHRYYYVGNMDWFNQLASPAIGEMMQITGNAIKSYGKPLSVEQIAEDILDRMVDKYGISKNRYSIMKKIKGSVIKLPWD